MPMAAPLIAVAAGYGAVAVAVSFELVVAGGIAAAMVGMGAAMIVSSLLAPKPPSLGALDASFSSLGAGRTQQVRQPITAHQYIYGTVKTSGPILFVHTTADDDGRVNGYFYILTALAGHEVSAIGDVYFGDELTSDAKFTGLARVTKHLGATSQLVDADWLSEIGSVWTGDHRLRGRAYLATRLKFDPVAFNGIPNISAIVQGIGSIYDPRDETTGWSDNTALCVANWITSPWGMGRAWSTLDEPSLIAAANICDEAVPLLAGGTEARYTCNGTFTADTAKGDVLLMMLSAMAGIVVMIGGKWYIHAGAAAIPNERVLTEDDLRAPMMHVPKRSMRDRFNGVRTVFVDPVASWQPVDAPPLLSPTYVAEDNGEILYRDLRFPFTTSRPTVQRLMKIELERNRRQGTVQFPAKLTAIDVKPWDGVLLSNDRYEWDEEQFRCVGWTLAEDGGIDLLLQRDDAAVYAWSASEETAAPPQPVITVPDPATIAAPADLDVTTPTTPTYPRLDATWDEVLSIWLAGYDVEFKADGAADWISYGRVVNSETISVARQSATDFRVRAVTGNDIPSSWTENLAPSVPTSPVATGASGQINLTWVKGSGSDTTQIFVHTADDFTVATLLTTDPDTSYSHTGLGAGQTRYYWFRGVNDDGNISDQTASVNATTS